MIKQLIEEGGHIEEEILDMINKIHLNGPDDPSLFEKLAYFKHFHGEILAKHEAKLIKVMGLFFKTDEPDSLLELIYSIFSDTIKTDTGQYFTPIQASAFKNIYEKEYFSFSAPTSSGKSYMLREIIKNASKDIIIVVPSRALIAEYYDAIINLVDKSVLVLQFVEDVNKTKTSRRIYILTPERSSELFKYSNVFEIEMFLFDEAQISEEEVRGLRFDSLVRRADRSFPNAKMVFSHPFIDNPEAQLLKHGFSKESSSRNYNFHTVGKIFASYHNDKFCFFSPYTPSAEVESKRNIVSDVLREKGTLLVYISKSKIYDGSFLADFSKYVELCPKVSDRNAVAIINKLRDYIGAGSDESEKHSTFIDMMSSGIVVHHGSMPLKARLLIEQFIKLNCARICFATSTLNQGVNMPFDIVWIDNFRSMPTLTIKNLIGRSGRSTLKKNTFDYGFTIVKKSNVSTFSKRMKETFEIEESSSLDNDINLIPEDLKDIVESVKEGTFNDEFNMPQMQLDRVSSANVSDDVLYILENLMREDVPISGSEYYKLEDTDRKKVKEAFKNIYISHLRKNTLTKAEASVLSAALPIMLWKIQGKSFSEIVSLRYAFLSNKDQRTAILSHMKKKEITPSKAKELIDKVEIRYSPNASTLPNSNLTASPLFKRGSTYISIDYDRIVYDTYDYLDKVISFSLTDPLCAALEMYWKANNDSRALALKNYLRFGTNNKIEIWLLRYGFDAEDMEWLQKHIDSIDANEILFKDSIHSESETNMMVVSRYI